MSKQPLRTYADLAFNSMYGLGGLVLAWAVMDSIQKGQLLFGRYMPSLFSLDREPGLFWTAVCIHMSAAVMLVCVSVFLMSQEWKRIKRREAKQGDQA